MSDELKNVVTIDDLMEEYLSDSIVADDELSESLFTCVDNYIDDLCVKVMDDENSVFESDTDSDTPFTYILDKVMEKVDTIEDISDEAARCKTSDESENSSDPDYCEGVDFDEITPEDFQLYISGNIDDDTYEDGYAYRANNSGFFDDSNFNA